MKAIQYIEDESFIVVNPDYPVISKENALKAIEIVESELKEKAIEVFKEFVTDYRGLPPNHKQYNDLIGSFTDKLNYISKQ